MSEPAERTDRKSRENFPGRIRRKDERKQPAILTDVLALILKAGVICLLAALLFTFVYGVFRCGEAGMAPAVKDGDLVIYYRLDKQYEASDIAVIERDGELSARRVAAVEGDTVDITAEGLAVNGAIQQERDIYEETLLYEEGIEFPVTLKEGEIFLLGDARTHAEDSRLYGPVKAEETRGKVIMLIRRRGI